jgi:CRP-like cAMP-binding protein
MSAPTAGERARIAAAFRAVSPLGDAELAPALDACEVRALRAGAPLLHAGEPATRVFVVLDGVLREFYALANGSERTKGFAVEGELIGSLSDLVASRPSRASIGAVTRARVASLPYALFAELAAEHADWSRFSAAAVLRLYLTKSEREWELLALDAAGRHERFRSRFPGLEARIPQREVASYLGITPVHLSRLRSRALAARRARATRARGSR